MELLHSFTVPASPQQTWALLTDLYQVGSCFPGATVTEASEEAFSGTVKVKLGPIAMVYSGSGAFVSRDDGAHRAVIEARGKDKRGNGTAGASVNLALSPDGSDGGTRVDVQTDLSITGKPAQFGRGVMQDVSDKLLGTFVECIEQTLAAPPEDLVEDSDPTGLQEAVSAPPTGAAGSDGPRSSTPHLHAVRDADEEVIDLGGALGPALLSRYGIPVAAVLGMILGYALGRGRSAAE